MEELKHHLTLFNNISLNYNTPSMSSSIQSVLSKTHIKFQGLQKLMFPDSDDRSFFMPLLPKHNKKHTHTKKKKRNLTKLQILTLHQSNNIEINYRKIPMSTNTLTSRNYHKTLNNTYSKENNHNESNPLNETYSCMRTTVNNTTSYKDSNTTNKHWPKLCLLPSSQRKGRNQTTQSYTNQSTEAYYTINHPSPHAFTLYENTNDNQSLIKTPLPSKMLKHKCSLIERKCHSVGKAVRRVPITLLKKRKKIEKMLNESHDTIDDITDDGKAKRITEEDMFNLSVKNKRIMREAICVQKIHPKLALEANKAIKTMFSIKPKDYKKNIFDEKTKIKFAKQYNRMSNLLQQNIKAKDNYCEYLAQIKLQSKNLK